MEVLLQILLVPEVPHAAVELLCAFLVFRVYRRYRAAYKLSGWLMIYVWMWTFGLTCVEDVIHAIAPLAKFFSGDIDLGRRWVPGTWANSRFTLHMLLMFGAIFADKKRTVPNIRFAHAGIFMGAFASLVFLWPGFMDYSGTYQEEWPHRRADLALTLMPLLSMLVIAKLAFASKMAPARYGIALLAGSASHLVMTFSHASFDFVFYVGHFLKVVECVVWWRSATGEELAPTVVKGQ